MQVSFPALEEKRKSISVISLLSISAFVGGFLGLVIPLIGATTQYLDSLYNIPGMKCDVYSTIPLIIVIFSVFLFILLVIGQVLVRNAINKNEKSIWVKFAAEIEMFIVVLKNLCIAYILTYAQHIYLHF